MAGNPLLTVPFTNRNASSAVPERMGGRPSCQPGDRLEHQFLAGGHLQDQPLRRTAKAVAWLRANSGNPLRASRSLLAAHASSSGRGLSHLRVRQAAHRTGGRSSWRTHHMYPHWLHSHFRPPDIATRIVSSPCPLFGEWVGPEGRESVPDWWQAQCIPG
jgi:hypothetical protein